MKYFSHTNKHTQILLYTLAGLSALIVAVYISSVRVHAEPASSSTVELIQTYCRSVVPSKAVKGCTEKNAEQARNVATYHVDDSQKAIDSGKTADEILKKAKGYIDEAKKKNPSSAKDFTNKLTTILKAKGGSLTKPSESTNKSATGLCAGSCQDPALDCAENKDKCDIMKKYVNPAIAFLAIFVGLAVTIGIISGGLRYASAGEDPQKVSAAKMQIRSAIIALMAFIFLYAAIQWLLPS